MSVTEEHVESWGSRLGSSLKGVLLGILLFIAAFPLLFWNEGRAVSRARVLDRGAKSCVSVQSDAVKPENEGKLVHTSGKLATPDILTDTVFGLKVNAIRFTRKVEMYQWRETSRTREEKQLGGSVKKITVYEYQKSWSTQLIDSSKFKEAGHTNPAAFTIPGTRSLAKNVTLGAFTLNEDFIAAVGGEKDYELPKEFKLPAALKGVVAGNMIYIPAAVPVSTAVDTTVAAAERNPVSAPEVGDVRISFKVIYPHDLSVVAKQTGKSFTAFPIEGDTIRLIANSIQSAEQMFQTAHSANNTMTWILRIVGFAMMYIGVSMVLKPLSVLGDVVPFIGDIIGAGASLIAFCIALPCSLVTIALAWLFYRPLVAIPLLLAAAGAVWVIVKKKKEAAQRKAAAEA